jgi:hypothetical protein
MTTTLETRVLKSVLEVLARLLSDPPTLTMKLLQILEHNESTLLAIRQEQGELACLRSENMRKIAQERRDLDEELRAKRVEWSEEEARRRKALESDEWATGRLRERLELAEAAAGIRPRPKPRQVAATGCESASTAAA